jgi:hypothetical protein
MTLGGGEAEEQRQARAATQQRMHPIAQQQRAGMVGGRMAKGGIGIGAAPGKNGSTIEDEIASARQTYPHPGPHQ